MFTDSLGGICFLVATVVFLQSLTATVVSLLGPWSFQGLVVVLLFSQLLVTKYEAAKGGSVYVCLTPDNSELFL